MVHEKSIQIYVQLGPIDAFRRIRLSITIHIESIAIESIGDQWDLTINCYEYAIISVGSVIGFREP